MKLTGSVAMTVAEDCRTCPLPRRFSTSANRHALSQVFAGERIEFGANERSEVFRSACSGVHTDRDVFRALIQWSRGLVSGRK
jgi:hypothetical protein